MYCREIRMIVYPVKLDFIGHVVSMNIDNTELLNSKTVAHW